MFKNMQQLLFGLFLAICILSGSPFWNQNEVFAQYNNFQTFSIEQGLPQSNVFCIYQDSRGYLWIGTDGGGASCFDGIKFRNFNKKDGLAGTVVRSIIEDKKGNLWFGTSDGISVYDGYQFITIDTSKGLSSNTIIRIFEGSKGNIWAGTSGGGLNEISLQGNNQVNVNVFTSEEGLSSDWIFDIHEDKKGRLWLATLNGGIDIITFSEDTFKIEYLKRGFDIPSAAILSIEEDKDGNLWFGSHDAGAFKVDISSDKVTDIYNISNGLDDNTIWDIHCDKNGTVWFGTNEKGIYTLHDSVLTNYDVLHGLPNNQVLDVFEDQEGNMWFATFGSGLGRLTGFNFSHFNEKDGLLNDQVYSIKQDKNRNYWLATYGAGLVLMNFENGLPIFDYFTTDDGLSDNTLLSLSMEENGFIWIATAENGISRFDPLAPEGQKFYNLTTDSGLVNNRVNCIFVDSKNNVWTGTSGGISKLDNIGFRNITEDDGLINNEVQTIIEDKKGHIWFGTLGGLAQYLGRGQMITYDEMEGLYDKRIHALVEDMHGDIWIGTFGGGLYKFDTQKDTMQIEFVVDDSVLSSNNIYSLIFLDDRTLLVGTDKGVDKLTLSASMGIIKVRNYNKSDGFIGVENHLNSIHKDEKNNIWFGTVKGLTSYSAKLENHSNIPPRTHISSMRLFFEDVDWQTKTDSVAPWFNLPSNLELPYDSNHVTFVFSGVSLNNPQKVMYRYMLEGLDNEWSPPRKDNEVVYSGLSHGTYTFKVKAVNENGIWNPNPASFTFTITPPFWLTWWFITTCSMFILISIYAYIKIREKKLKEEKEYLEHVVQERTAEVVQQKEVIEEKNRDIMDSIEYAERIQQAILPPDRLVKEFLKDSFILFKPKDIVSGDFYWMDHKDDKIMWAAVDCTGHGVPGAFVSIVGHNGLKRSVNEFGLRTPNEILDKLTNLVEDTFSQNDDTKLKDGMDIGLVVMDTKENTMSYSGANNPLYFLRKKSEGPLNNGKEDIPTNIESEDDCEYDLYQVKGDSQPIGAFDHRRPFTRHTFQLKPNDIFYVFSDGFADQFGGPKGKKFKYKPFKQLLLSIYNKPMQEQREILDQAIEDWKGDEYEQIDDICVIGVRVQ